MLQTEPLDDRIKSVRNEYKHQRSTLKKISDERLSNWEKPLYQLETDLRQI